MLWLTFLLICSGSPSKMRLLSLLCFLRACYILLLMLVRILATLGWLLPDRYDFILACDIRSVRSFDFPRLQDMSSFSSVLSRFPSKVATRLLM